MKHGVEIRFDGTSNGAGAFVDLGYLISDCIISNNQTALCFDAATPGGKGGGFYLRGTALWLPPPPAKLTFG